MLSALPFLMGFQLLLQAVVLDVTAQPQRRLAESSNSPRAAFAAPIVAERLKYSEVDAAQVEVEVPEPERLAA
jgi:hypothetical protein